MERLNENLRTAAILLDALKCGELRWTQFVRAGYTQSSPWQVHSLIHWLVDHGFVDRPGRGVYAITGDGKALLTALQSLKTEKWLPDK